MISKIQSSNLRWPSFIFWTDSEDWSISVEDTGITPETGSRVVKTSVAVSIESWTSYILGKIDSGLDRAWKKGNKDCKF